LGDATTVPRISSTRSIVEPCSRFIDSSTSGYEYYSVASSAMDFELWNSKKGFLYENEKINSVLGVIGVILGFIISWI